MKTADFAFALPAELIAQEPLPERSASRLLAVEADEEQVDDRQHEAHPRRHLVEERV